MRGRLVIRAVAWTLLAGGCGLHILILTPAAALGRFFVRLAQRADVKLDDARYALQRDSDRVAAAAEQVGYAVRHGGTSGCVEYDYLDDRDMELLARAIDNRGCYVKVWPRRAEWRRRDRCPLGEKLSLAALPPADRDAWADAIANLDGEGER